MKKINKTIENTAARIAYNSAKRSANTTCMSWFGQSKLPETVKKLRKF